MQALEKGMSGGMVIAEGDGIPATAAAAGVHTGQRDVHGFAGVGVGVVGV